MTDIRITPLKIIEDEIERLSKQSQEKGLDLNDVKKLETLIKTRQLILGEPTEINKTTVNSDDSFTDKQILDALTNKGDERAKVKKTAKKQAQ